MRHALGALLLVCVCLSCGGAPDLDGDGVLRRVEIPGNRGTLESLATPNEKFVAFLTAGPNSMLLLTDQQLSPVGREYGATLALGPARASNTHMLAYAPFAFRILSLPDLTATETLDGPHVREALSVTLFPTLCPVDTGWVCVNSKGAVVAIETSPLRLGQSGQAATRVVRGVAWDGKTKTLVLCGDDTFAEVYDPIRMVSVARRQLDCREFDVCYVRAGNGTAWIPTRDGLFLHFDIASATVVGRTVLTAEEGDKDVSLDLSPSGRHLAAVSSLSGRGDDVPTVLKVFRVAGRNLTEVASARVDLPYTVGGITILEKEKLVILNGHRVLVWDYGAKTDGS